MKSSVNAYLRRIERLHSEIQAVIERRERFVSAAEFAEQLIKLDEWQRRVLQSRSNRIILNCCRQAGKTTVAALMALHRVLYFPGSLVLIVSPSLRQSSEMFRRVMHYYNMLPDADSLSSPERESALRVEFSNGSRVLSLPGQESTLRGYSSVDLLIADEAARIPDELYYSVRPMLAVSGGRLIVISTPYGKRGFFYDIWTNDKGWEKIMITADDCPRIPREFLQEEKASMPTHWFLQEYYCQFIDTEYSVFPADFVRQLISADVEPLEV